MKVEIERNVTADFVRIDVTGNEARTARVIGRSKQRQFAFDMAHLVTGSRTLEDNGFRVPATLIYCRGKRGVSNDGFVAVVRVERG